MTRGKELFVQYKAQDMTNPSAGAEKSLKATYQLEELHKGARTTRLAE
jgi:hypothetical protein